jgi:hypothetical protein
MSGVNWARRNSRPSARAIAFATERLRDAGHTLKQDVAAHEQERRGSARPSPPGPRRPSPPRLDPVAQALHQR